MIHIDVRHSKKMALTVLGAIFIAYWAAEFFWHAVVPGDYGWALWLSDAGFLFTGIALMVRNEKLTTSLFCALFVIETWWVADLAWYMVSGQESSVGFAAYVAANSSSAPDFYFDLLYHALIPIGLAIAAANSRASYRFGWLGAAVFTGTLVLLTWIFAGPESQVNCLGSLNACHTDFSFLYSLSVPYRIAASLAGLTLFVFIPTNAALRFLKKRQLARVN